MSDDAPLRPSFVTIVDAVAALPARDVGRLIVALRERLGVREPEPPDLSRYGTVNPPGPDEFSWSVRLDSVGPDRVGVMRVLRALLDCPINDAKAAVENVPHTIPLRSNHHLAQDLARALVAAGADARACSVLVG